MNVTRAIGNMSRREKVTATACEATGGDLKRMERQGRLLRNNGLAGPPRVL